MLLSTFRALSVKLLPFAEYSDTVGRFIEELEELIDRLNKWIALNPRNHVSEKHPGTLDFIWRVEEIAELTESVLRVMRRIDAIETEARSQQLSPNRNEAMMARKAKAFKVRQEVDSFKFTVEYYHTHLILALKTLKEWDRINARRFRQRREDLAEIDRLSRQDQGVSAVKEKGAPLAEDRMVFTPKGRSEPQQLPVSTTEKPAHSTN